MKTLLSIAIFILFAFGSVRGQECGGVPAKKSEITREGGNVFSVLEKEGIFNRIAGKITDGIGSPMGGVLVELFDSPDYLLCVMKPGNPNNCNYTSKNQRRLYAYITGNNGEFCFDKNIKASKYELRVSKDSGWNVEHLIVVFDARKDSAKDGGIEVWMSIGG